MVCCQTEMHSGYIMLAGEKKVAWEPELTFLHWHVTNKHLWILGEPFHTVKCIRWWSGGPLYLHESGQRSLILTGWFHRAHKGNNGCLFLWFLKPLLYRAAQPGGGGRTRASPLTTFRTSHMQDSEGRHQPFRVEGCQVRG